MSEQILQNVLDESIQTFRNYKKLAEKAMTQVSDEEFFKVIDDEANSIAIIAKHIGGNLRSRWTEFLTTDGEKSDRDRDAEFTESENDTRESLMESWENGWAALFGSMEALQTEDLGQTVQIRGESFTVFRAISRSLTHTVYHVGEIVFLAKYLRSGEWQNLSIPKNKSAEFNAYLADKKDKGNFMEASQDFAKRVKDKG